MSFNGESEGVTAALQNGDGNRVTEALWNKDREKRRCYDGMKEVIGNELETIETGKTRRKYLPLITAMESE